MTDQLEPVEQVKNRGHALLAGAEAALERGEIDEEAWYRKVAAVITPAYLAADNPRAQSGHGGDEAQWRHARGLIVEAIHRDGTFLDIGCANGHLLESLVAWAGERGRRIGPHGLDISPELASLARQRLPQWAGRIHVGNALDWTPPRKFDFVRTGLEYVPQRRQRDLVAHLMDAAVAPGGRLIIGTFSEEEPTTLGDRATAAVLSSWGFAPTGGADRPHRDPRLRYRVLWIDRSD